MKYKYIYIYNIYKKNEYVIIVIVQYMLLS